MKGAPTVAPRHAVYVRLDQLDRWLDPLVGTSDQKKADFCGVRYLTIWRLRNIPNYRVSQEFIAAVLRAPWPANRRRPTFEDLFVAREVKAA